MYDIPLDFGKLSIEGINSLAITTMENDVTYTTYIYYYKDALREIVVNEQSVFSLETGQEIIKTGGFLAEMIHKDLIKITITTTNHQTQVLYLPIHSAGKEQP